MMTAPQENLDQAQRYRRLLGGQHKSQDVLRRVSAERLASVLWEYVKPDSVLDVGCGRGSFLAALQKAGATDLQGIDGPWLDPDILCIEANRVRACDLQESLYLGRRYDLVVSMEVAEHLAPERAESFVADLVRHGDLILFSAAVPFQGGAGHRNERWPSWWAKKFTAHGFVPVDLFRPRLWDDTRVLWWLRQNLLLYVHPRQFSVNLRLTDLYRDGAGRMPLDVVHPVLLAQYALRSESGGGDSPAAASAQKGRAI